MRFRVGDQDAQFNVVVQGDELSLAENDRMRGEIREAITVPVKLNIDYQLETL